jgi:hypothetical protein
MRDLIDEITALEPDERERLQRFADAFERLDASQYIRFAEAPTPADLAAETEAIQLVGTGERREAVKAAVGVFTDAATVAYSRRPSLTDTFLMFQSLPDRGDDRLRLLASVERAVVALILRDGLSEQSRMAMLGPWADLVYEVVPEEPG